VTEGSGFEVLDFGFRVSGFESMVRGFGFGVDIAFRVHNSGLMVHGVGSRVQDLWFRV